MTALGAAEGWSVGDSLLCNGKGGTVRWVGKLEGKTENFIGVEFWTQAAGQHDGILDGKRYFGPTQPYRATFKRQLSGSLAKYAPEVEAATKLQSQVRRKADAESAEYQQCLKMYNAMDNRNESDAFESLARTDTAETMLVEEDLARQSKDHRQRQGTQVCGASDIPTGTLGADFNELQKSAPTTESAEGVPTIEFIERGPGEPVTISRECLDRVLTHIKQPKASPLNAKCVINLIKHAIEMTKQEVTKPVVDVPAPPSPGRTVIVGDTHGQLQDFLWILFEHGQPSPTNVFIINGDIADRGAFACEILILIYIFKLWRPGCIFVNRGNHEAPSMNSFHGFRDECMWKWQPTNLGLSIWAGWNELFKFLPFATILDKEIYIVHAGLCRKDMKLKTLVKVDFRIDDVRKCTPTQGTDSFLFDSLWADPYEGKGIQSSARGERVVAFGSDVTKRFLQNEGLKLVVRSHEVPDTGRGYKWHHDGKLATIFSASNYCGKCGNLGAVIHYTRGEAPKMHEFWAPPMEELFALEADADRARARVEAQCAGLQKQKTFRRRSIVEMEMEIMMQVQELIVKFKSELFLFWSEAAGKGNRTISPEEWREGCSTVLGEKLPWCRLQDSLGVVGPTGRVDYVQFLSSYRVAYESSEGLGVEGWDELAWYELKQMLLKADLPLREALAALDATSDGIVSHREFVRLLNICKVNVSPAQASWLLWSLTAIPTASGRVPDTPKGGDAQALSVCVWELLERLTCTLPVPTKGMQSSEEEVWGAQLAEDVRDTIIQYTREHIMSDETDWKLVKMLAAWFEDVDKSQNGYLSAEELTSALEKQLPMAGKNIPRKDLERLIGTWDIVGSREINFFEMLNGLRWAEKEDIDVKTLMNESIHAAIYFNKDPARNLLRNFDGQLTGCVTPENFVRALSAVQTASKVREPNQNIAVSRHAIEKVAKSLPRTAAGMIEYEKFLDSFRIVDAEIRKR